MPMMSSLCSGPEQGGGATGAIAPGSPLQVALRDEIYLFEIKYSFEKFRNSEAIQEYNSILFSNSIGNFCLKTETRY